MKHILLVLMLLSSISNWACDACGCRPSYGGWGPGYQLRSSISVSYQQGVFHSKHPGLFDPTKWYGTEEIFRTTAVTGRIRLSDRWLISTQVPFVFNRYRDDASLQKVESIGDIRAAVTYRVLNYTEDLPFGLDAQVGVKAPSGTWKDGPSYLPAAILPGTGSWDLTGGVRAWKGLGEKATLEGQLNGLLPGSNELGDRFGPRLSSILGVRYLIVDLEKLQVSSNLSVQYMYDGPDHTETNRESVEVPLTSGYFWSALAGIQVSYSSWHLEMGAGAPFIQEFADGLVAAQPTIQTQLTYTF